MNVKYGDKCTSSHIIVGGGRGNTLVNGHVNSTLTEFLGDFTVYGYTVKRQLIDKLVIGFTYAS